MHPAHPLEYNCVPATPKVAVAVTGDSARHAPVWFELQLLQLLDLLQLHSGGALSDVKCVAALRDLHQQTHQRVPPAPGEDAPSDDGPVLCELSEHQLRGHLGNALREWRRLQLTVGQEVKAAEQGDARRERGSGLFACTICACRALTAWAEKNWTIEGVRDIIQYFVAKVRGRADPEAAPAYLELLLSLRDACCAAYGDG